ncbi:MAG: sigma-54 dependent transcriptional regulator [Treponema sp.]|nr:sigma-54 dependent transcriptional regulator [Treponema sp.]
MAIILIIDDEPGIRQTLASVLEDEKYKVRTAGDAPAGMEILHKEKIDMVFLDVLLPKMGGIDALEKIRSGWPGVEIVMISGHANVDMAVRAVKLGAFDFLEKPLSLEKVLTVSRNALAIRKLREENRALKKTSFVPREEIIGKSTAMDMVRELVNQAASCDARILITGESGTGKEIIARAIHNSSARAGHAFVELNCAAIPESLIESELFGHEKGAFTDAINSRKGRFELADGGTLFLDEIGDMSLHAQAKVLRVIQEQKIERLGGEKSIETNVRIIAATNQDLEKACDAGLFRQDLFFRLNVIPIPLPPLRERIEDIPLLLTYFLENLGAEPCNMDQEAADFLASYEWPGNVRELRNLAERINVMYSGKEIGRTAIEELIRRNPKDSVPEKPGKNDKNTQQGPAGLPDGIMDMDMAGAKECFEKYFLEFQLSKNNGIIQKTAEAIGVNPGSLYAKIRKYKMRYNSKEYQ